MEPLVSRPVAKPHVPKARPDARPMRLALSAGGLAALSALAAAIVLPPSPSLQATVDAQQAATDPPGTPIAIQQPIKYVQLLPGQTAPAGATVIDAAAPTPMTVVVDITAAPQKAPKPRVIKTTQSGKVVKP